MANRSKFGSPPSKSPERVSVDADAFRAASSFTVSTSAVAGFLGEDFLAVTTTADFFFGRVLVSSGFSAALAVDLAVSVFLPAALVAFTKKSTIRRDG